MYRNTRSTNRNSGNNWWFRLGKAGAGGTGEESVKHIRKVSFSVIIPTAAILALLGIGIHAGKKWIDRSLNGNGKKSDNDDAGNPQNLTPADEERIAKERDLKVKNRICRSLGLLNPETPQPTHLLNEKAVNMATSKPKPLVGTLFKRGDCAVVVSSPGVGKSIFCWQTGIAISEGRCVEYLPSCSDHADPQKVFIYDGELDNDDVMQRYGHREYSENLVRYAASKFRTIYYLLQHIYDLTVSLDEDATFILDNLYALMPTMSNEDTRKFLDGLDIIQREAFDRGHRITIILVTHTVKDGVGIPRLKDVAGSAHISRFAKSVILLVPLPGIDNQVAVITNKKRYSEHKDAYVMELKHDGFLHFEYLKKVSNQHIFSLFSLTFQMANDNEDEKQKYTTPTEKEEELVRTMQNLRNQGLSDREIAHKVGVSGPTVSKHIGSNGNGHHHGGRKPNRH